MRQQQKLKKTKKAKKKLFAAMPPKHVPPELRKIFSTTFGAAFYEGERRLDFVYVRCDAITMHINRHRLFPA